MELAIDPAAENRMTYESNVPWTNPWPKIFKAVTNTTERVSRRAIAIITGRLDSPNLKKGIGLGIANSIETRNSDAAASRAIVSR